MKISVRELRNSLKRILDAVQLGEEVVVTMRKYPIAKIIAIKEIESKECDIGFGMWSDHPEMKNVDDYLRHLRKGRQHDF